jgi:aquaporin Z
MWEENMDMPRRLGAEFFGTLADVCRLRQCCAAHRLPSLDIGFLLAFAVLTMPYAAGHISGGHFNCAVTVGLWAGAKSMGFGC